jgi:hypothetical protein
MEAAKLPGWQHRIGQRVSAGGCRSSVLALMRPIPVLAKTSGSSFDPGRGAIDDSG